MQTYFKHQNRRVVGCLLCSVAGCIASGPRHRIVTSVILSILNGAVDAELVCTGLLLVAGGYTLEIVYVCVSAAEAHDIPAPKWHKSADTSARRSCSEQL